MSAKTATGLMLVFFLVASSGEAQAGHCRAGWSRDRIQCLNSEVAYLTAKQKQTQRNLDALKAEIPKRVSAAFPAGTIITWFSKDEKPPKGWELCDGKDGRPDLNGLWIVGTDKPSEVGMVINQDPPGPTMERGEISSMRNHRLVTALSMRVASTTWQPAQNYGLGDYISPDVLGP